MRKRNVFRILVCMLCFGAFAVSVFAAQADSISIVQTKNLTVGDSKPLILTASPDYADVPEVQWSSSDESVATVDERGIVTGVKTGQVTITATAVDDPTLTASVTMLIRTNYKYNIGWSGSFTMQDNNTVTTADIPVEHNKIQKAWDAKVGNSPVVIVDDYVYTYNGVNTTGKTDNDGILYKVNKTTGEIVDSITCNMSGGYYYSYIIYGGGLIYVSSINKVMAVDPDTFTVLWYADVPETFYATVQFVGDCIVTRGIVLNATTGEEIAQLEGSYNYSSGVERNGLYYIASMEGILYAFATADWSVKDSVEFRSSDMAMVQPGVAYYNGRLYWSDGADLNMCSIQLDESTGFFVEASLKKTSCDIQSVCVPVAASDRVYLAGTKDNEGVIGVFNAASLELIYTAEGANEKIQSTPILREVKAGGSSIMSVGESIPSSLPDGNYIIVQDYGDSIGSARSALRVLKDTGNITSGEMMELITIEPQNYAYQQLAFDKDGSLYCSNDEGYLVKYRLAMAEVPNITKNLSTVEVKYDLNAQAEALRVNASVSDGGMVTYQWQSSSGNGVWADINGANTNEYTPSSAVAGTTYYRCVITNTLNGQSEQIDSKIAKITILEAESENTVLYGDVDGDGEVAAKDATELRRYLAEWTGYSIEDIDIDAADVNVDGEVNAADAAILARFLAGWTGVTIGTK